MANSTPLAVESSSLICKPEMLVDMCSTALVDVIAHKLQELDLHTCAGSFQTAMGRKCATAVEVQSGGVAACAAFAAVVIAKHGLERALARAFSALRKSTYDAERRILCGVPAWAAVIIAAVVMSVHGAIVHTYAHCTNKDGRDSRGDGHNNKRDCHQPVSHPIYIMCDGQQRPAECDAADGEHLKVGIRTLARMVGILTGKTAVNIDEIEQLKKAVNRSGVLGQLATTNIDLTRFSKKQMKLKQRAQKMVVQEIVKWAYKCEGDVDSSILDTAQSSATTHSHGPFPSSSNSNSNSTSSCSSSSSSSSSSLRAPPRRTHVRYSPSASSSSSSCLPSDAAT